jgi:hypothetical protein
MDKPQELEVQTLDFSKQIDIAAPIDITWESVLLELGPESAIPENKPYPFVLEAWPGGRWFRDLGNNTGHLWAHVQVIKPPTLLELIGPMFASFPCTSHVTYRLTPGADGGGTRLTITHRACGLMPLQFMKGVDEGWSHGLQAIDRIAQRIKAGRQKK